MLCAALIALALPAGASAATIGVTTTDDTVAGDGLCSLREAVTAANTNASAGGCPAGGSAAPDRIEVPPGTYELAGSSREDANATGDLDVTEAVTIAGAGADTTTIDAGDHDRSIDVADVPGNALTIDGISITNGSAPSGRADEAGEPGGAIRGTGAGTSITVRDAVLTGNAAGDGSDIMYPPLSPPRAGGGGGAISAAGELTIVRSTLRFNRTGEGGYQGPFGYQSGGSGGAVRVLGPLTVSDSTFSSNETAGDSGGGGAVAAGSAPATIANSTFTANHLGFSRCCGLGAGGAIVTSGPLQLAGSTISGNDAGAALGNLVGGSLFIGATGSAQIENSIVAGNGDGGDEIAGEGTVSLRYSLIGEPPTGPFEDVAGNQIGTNQAPLDPGLGGLGNNGGPTVTMAPTPSSPAIDAGSAFGLTTDQRGGPRPVDYTNVASVPGGDGSDIGAVELPSPADAIAPELSASGEKVLQAESGKPPKNVRVSLASNEDCTAKVSGVLEARGRNAKLRSARVRLPDDLSSVTAKLRLPKRARRIATDGLAHGSVKVELAASCTDAAGNTAERTLGVRIERTRRG